MKKHNDKICTMSTILSANNYNFVLPALSESLLRCPDMLLIWHHNSFLDGSYLIFRSSLLQILLFIFSVVQSTIVPVTSQLVVT